MLNGFEFHIVSIYSLISTIVAGLLIGRIFRMRTRIPEGYLKYVLYDVAVLNIAFTILIFFSHGLLAQSDIDDRYLWLEAALLNVLFIVCIYLGERKWRG